MSSITLSRKNLMPSWTNELFDTGRFFKPELFDFDHDLKWANGSQLPSVNFIENDKHFRVEMAAPGYKKEDFRIKVLNETLTISAEKKIEKEEKNDKFTRREFSYNNFERSFLLPENCLPEKADAKYENGILVLSLPKREVAAVKAAKEIKIG